MANGNKIPEMLMEIMKERNRPVNDPGFSIGPQENNAHENIDTLINQNDNKDFFELIKGMLPSAGTMENFHPGMAIPKLLQLMNQPAGTEQAFQRGLTESIFGEPDPIGPQGLPFSQFMQQKQALNPKVKSIVEEHINKNLFKK